jgi:hypothetical protein
MTKYGLNEKSKELTKRLLEIDCLKTKITGLTNEKSHLDLNFKESEEFKHVFESKNKEL